MISVILVTYNSMNVLPECVSSLQRCSCAQDLEIIIVDNSSVDGTREWVQDYQTKTAVLPYTSVKGIFLAQNRGYAFANNRGLESATGDYYLLLNPDTIVGQDALTKCREVLIHDPTIGAVGCRLEMGNGSLDRACKRSFPTLWNSFARLSGLSLLFPHSRWLSQYNLTSLNEGGSYAVDCICGAFMMVPKAVCQSVGGLDEAFFMYGEDIDWCYRIKKHGYGVWYEGSVTTLHLKGGNGGKRSRDSLYHFYDTMYIYYTRTLGNSEKQFSSRVLHLVLGFLFHVQMIGRRLTD